MRKLGIAFLAVVLILGLAQGILWWRVSSAVKTVADQSAMMADVSYRGVYAWLWGDMGVRDIKVTPKMALPENVPAELVAERIGVEIPPSLMFKIALKREPDPADFRTLGIVVQGMRTDLDAMFANPDPLKPPYPAGPCGLERSDLPSTLLDSRIDLTFDSTARTLRVNGDYRLRDFLAVEFDTTVGGVELAGPSAAAAADIDFRSFTVNLQDTGYQALIATHCQNRGVNTEQLAGAIDDYWRGTLGAQGVGLSDNLLAAMQRFFTTPGNRISFTLGISEPLKTNELAIYQDPTLLWARLSPQIAFNGQAIDDARLTIATPPQPAATAATRTPIGPVIKPEQPSPPPKAPDARAVRAEPVAVTPAPPANAQPAAAPQPPAPVVKPRPSPYQAVAKSDIGQYVGKKVRLTTQSDARIEGVLTEFKDDRVKVRARIHGGEVIMPLQLGNITVVEIDQR